MNKSILLTLCVVLFSSCQVTLRTGTTAPVEDIGVHQYPTVADLDVKEEKVTQTVEWNFVPFNLGQPSMKVRKSNLIAEMLQSHSGDVLLEPQTIFTKESFGKRTLTVSGFVGKFKNFRKASETDLKALAVGYKEAEKPVYNVANKKPVAKQLSKNEEKPESKNQFKVTFGMNVNNLVSSSSGPKVGFALNGEYQRFLTDNLYYTGGLGFCSRGFNHEEHADLTSYIFCMMPVGAGYRVQLNKNSNLFFNLGWYFDVSMDDDINYVSGNSEGYEIQDIFDNGLRYGIGYQYKNISFEIMNYSGMVRRIGNTTQNSIAFSLGYRF